MMTHVMTVASRHIAALAVALLAFGCAPAAALRIEHPPQAPRVLNNFVTEVLLAHDLKGEGTHRFSIDNPRRGWLFFRTRALAGRAGEVRLSIRPEGGADSPEDLVIEYGRGDHKTVERMRFLDPGRYTVGLRLKDAEVSSLEIRMIPIINYERFHGSFQGMLGGFPEYDRDFLTRCGMLDSINTIGTYDGFKWLKEWQDGGKHAIRIAGGHGFDFWDGCMNSYGVNGIIIDEFYPGISKNFPAWVDDLKRVRQRHPGKLCILYIAGGADALRPLIEPLKDLDFYIAPEEQIYETRLTEQELIEKGFALGWISQFKDSYFPDVSARTVHSVGVYSGPSPSKYNDDVYPDRSWKVHRELHLHELATDPVHQGAGGIEIYQSTMCDEEYLRWMARLFRHYCIEGSSERLSKDPYVLNHLQNPDFEQGLEGWTLEAAAADSVEVRKREGFGVKVQGRHAPADVGDAFLWTRRHAEKPNVIWQEIRNLEPGRYYSVKMITADHGNLHKWQLHNISLHVGDPAVVMPQQCFQTVWRHNPEKEFGNKPTYPNFHRVVFRARSETVKLAISDWQRTYRHAPVPTAPVGQELMINFIQIEPYLMPD